MRNSITIATCCYEKDWRIILAPGYLSKQFAKHGYPFAEKMLIINTEKNREAIAEAAEKLRQTGDIDCFYFAADFKDDFCKKFHISSFNYEHSFRLLNKGGNNNPLSMLKSIYGFYIKKKGNYRFISPAKKMFDCSGYALGPLCALYKATSDYLLYFTEDCSVEENGDEWIDKGINLLNQHSDCIAVRPSDDDLDKPYVDVFQWLEDFWICYAFTDRMFLTNTSTMSKVDFNAEPVGAYPPYGGAGFEAKVFYHMCKNQKKVLICPRRKYIHECEEYITQL